MKNANMKCYKYYKFYYKILKMICQFLNIQQKNNNFFKFIIILLM